MGEARLPKKEFLLSILKSYLLSTVRPDCTGTFGPFIELATRKRTGWKTVSVDLLNFLSKCSAFANQQELADFREWLRQKGGNKARDILKALNHFFVTGEW